MESLLSRGAWPLGLPYTRSRVPLRRRAPCAWLARVARSLDEASSQPAFGAKTALQARHASAVGTGVVIVTHQVQQPVQRQNFQLIGVAMPGLASLPARNSRSDREIRGFERQYVGRLVLLAILPVERADALIGHERDGKFGGRPFRGHAGQPRGEPGSASRSTAPVGDEDADPTALGVHCTLRRL